MSQIVTIPHVNDRRGNLGFVELGAPIDFSIKRVYYLYDVPGGAERGAHAHRELQQLIVAVSGSFEVELYDGFTRRSFHLNRAYEGLLVRPGSWRELRNFSSGAVCLVLASMEYDESDYIRDINEFERFVRQ
ncbi:FdtA/QdtA family cupin domain-containing protein [Tianweitania sp.]|uniref:sugar 3,4-ketoisomerase n=1 Tax=Tianweitania sp. TaxID=2021634 RepID=UPI0028995B45|nr:FdtA/QdtA family cupin domain-containing protein [Tianweitania sp.]